MNWSQHEPCQLQAITWTSQQSRSVAVSCAQNKTQKPEASGSSSSRNIRIHLSDDRGYTMCNKSSQSHNVAKAAVMQQEQSCCRKAAEGTDLLTGVSAHNVSEAC